MKITYDKDNKIYVVESRYEEKDILRGAGFRWNSVSRFWWTAEPLVARRLIDFCDEEAKERIAEVEQRIEASRSAEADIDIPAPGGYNYYPYQRAGIAFVSSLWEDNKSALIADEMGLGKTIQAIGLINLHGFRRVLVVCPATVKTVWLRELERWLVEPISVGMAGKNGFPLEDVVIINYDVLKKYAKEIREKEWDLVVFDESHYLKNPKAQRTQYALGKWDRDEAKRISPIPAKHYLFLTGTPILNRPVELWPLLKFADPEGLGKNWKYFVTRYCDGYQDRYGWRVDGASNLGELQERLRSRLMIRRLKNEVLTELPPKVRQVVELPANGDYAHQLGREKEVLEKWREKIEELKALAEVAKAESEEAYREAVKKLSEGLRVAFTEIASVRHETALAKVPLALQFLLDLLESEEKIVVFAHHHDVVEALRAGLEENEIKVVVLTGETPQKKRGEVIRDFQEGDARVFLGSIQASGLGITLTASSHAVFVELDWVPANITQAEDRLHRVGQRDSVFIQHLVLEGSIDAHLAQTLLRKQRVLDEALDKEPEEEPILPVPSPVTEEVRVAKIEEEAQKLDPKLIPLVHEGLRAIASLCDGARDRDYAGFNKLDARIGHELAERETLTPKQAVLGLRLCRRYRGQIPDIWEKLEGGMKREKIKK